NAPLHKAQAVSLLPPGPWSAWDRTTSEEAIEAALEGCQVFFGHACGLVAIDEALQPLGGDGRPVSRDMPRAAYAGNFDPAQLPGAWEALRKRGDVVGYGGAPGPKAVSFHPVRSRVFIVTKAASQHAAEADSLKACND